MSTTPRNPEPDITRWAIEFLLRQLLIPAPTITNILSNLDVSSASADPCFRKTVLLHQIDSEISDGRVSEKTLDSIELIEEIDRNAGHLIMDSMKEAYCAVAVECAVKYLVGNLQTARKGKFFEALKRIWKKRIGGLEKEGKGKLITVELRKCGELLEAAMRDIDVCETLVKRNTRNDAMELVRAYLVEAIAVLGPTFTEMVARTEERGRRAGECREISSGGGRDDGGNAGMEVNIGSGEVSLGVDAGEGVSRLADDLPTADVGNVGIEVNIGGAGVSQDVDAGEGASRLADDSPTTDGGNVRMEMSIGGDGGSLDVDSGEGASRLTNDSPTSDRPDKRSREIQKNKMVRIHSDVAPLERPKGPIKLTDVEHTEGYIASSSYDTISTDEVNRVQAALRASSEELRGRVKDPLPDAIQQADGIITEMARNLGTLVEIQNAGGGDTVICELVRKILNRDPSVQNQNGKDAGSASQIALPPAENQARKGTNTDASNPSFSHAVPYSVQNHKQTEADAPHPTTYQNAELSGRNQEGKGVDGPNHSTDQPRESNSGIASFSLQNNVSKPSLMDRNGTARTFEWHDSIDGSPEGTSNQMYRIRLDSPKRKAVSPLRKYEPVKVVRRRKPSRWSLEEEDALREGVKKFGKGNWKLILNFNRDMFLLERTEVDLKDKWRNMTRYD